MPLTTIWRDPKLVTDKKVVVIRDILLFAVQETLQVNLNEVEVRIHEIGPLDINYMPIGIEIDTGTGKGSKRVKNKKKLVNEIAQCMFRANVLDDDWIGQDKSYIWIRICESSFVPIGYPDYAR